MSFWSDLTTKLFKGGGTGTPNNSAFVSTSGTYGSELYTLMTGAPNGIAVSERTAMSVAAIHACVSLVGGAVASIPLHIYKKNKDGRERYDSDLWYMFNESPDPSWTSASAWQYTMQSILLKGDSFWRIIRESRYSPNIIGLRPIHPDFVVVSKDSQGYNWYTINELGTQTTYHRDDVLHFTGLGFDGLRSMTPIQYALRNAGGIALSANKLAGDFFEGGARPDHAIEVPAEIKLSKEQRDMMQESWGKQRDSYGQGKTPVLTGGMKVVPLTINASDSQLLETRQFQVEEIARIFGVPPHMIGKTDASTSWGSGIEQMSIGFVRYTLRRHIDAIQQEINRKVWPSSRLFFCEFNTDSLLDGDSKAQAEYFARAIGGPGAQGWMTVNEVRRLKNLKPIDGGDELTKAAQQQPAQQQQGTKQ